MDRSAPPCAPMEFRDWLFHVPASLPPCQSWAPYIVLSVLLLVARFGMLAVNLAVLWRLRREQWWNRRPPQGGAGLASPAARKGARHSSMFAWTPLLEFLHTVLLAVLLVTAPWVGALQGASWVCLSLSMYFFFWGAILFTNKMVHTVRMTAATLLQQSFLSSSFSSSTLLKGRGGTPNRTASAAGEEERGATDVSSYSGAPGGHPTRLQVWTSRVMVTLSVLTMHGFLVAWVCGATVVPGSLTANKVAEWSLCMHAVVALSFSVWEVTWAFRLLNAYLQTIPGVGGDATSLDPSAKSRRDRLQRTVDKLRRTMLSLMVIWCIVVPFFFCLALDVYHLTWGVVMAMMVLTALASSAGLLPFLNGRRGRRPVVKGSGAVGGGGGEAQGQAVPPSGTSGVGQRAPILGRLEKQLSAGVVSAGSASSMG